MFTLLTLDAARDSVARQFQYGEPLEAAAPAARRPTATAHRRGSRTASLARRANGALMRTMTGATWSPTR